MGQYRSGGDNEVRSFPWPVVDQERDLFLLPLAPVLQRHGRVKSLLDDVTAHPKASSLVNVGLDPDHNINQIGQLSAGSAHPLNDHRRGPGGDIDMAGAAVRLPGRRLVVHLPPGVQRPKDAVEHQVVPANAGMRPRNVIGMHDRGRGHHPAQATGQGRLAAAPSAIDRDDPRPR